MIDRAKVWTSMIGGPDIVNVRGQERTEKIREALKFRPSTVADDTGNDCSASAISGTLSVQSRPLRLKTRPRSPSRRQMKR